MATKKKTNAALLSPIERILTVETEHKAKDDKSVILYTCKNGEAIELEVVPVLSFEEMHNFVSTVVEAVFLSNEYAPIVKSFIINNMIIRHYLKSNVDINDTLAVELVYSIDLVSLIADKIDGEQYFDMMDAIKSEIEFKKQELLSTERKLLNDSIANCERLADEASKCIEAFRKIADQFKDINPAEALDTYKKLVDMGNQDFANNVLALHKQE